MGTISTTRIYPVRVGCYVEFSQTFKSGFSRYVRGTVIESTYTDQGHTFVVKHVDTENRLITVSGATLYTNLAYHEQGERSKIELRRALKRGKKNKAKWRKRKQDRGKNKWR